MSEKENTTNDAIVKTENSSILLAKAVETLTTLAEGKDAEFKDRILNLARLASPTIKGLEGPAQITIPQIIIYQPTSNAKIIPETAKVGGMYTSEGVDLGDKVTFIPVLAHKTRKKWGDEYLDCISFDGDNGSKYGACDSCNFGRFEQGRKTLCSSGHTFFAVTEDLRSIYRIDFLKTSAKAGRNVIRLTIPPALWGRSFVLTTENVKKPQQNYYIFQTAPTGETIDPETQEVCEALHGFFQANYLRAQEAQRQFTFRGSSNSNEQETTVEEESDSDSVDYTDSM